MPATRPRLYALDGLRVVAMLAVIVGHAAIPYMQNLPASLLWVVAEPQASRLYDAIAWGANCTAMPMFFVIAGIAAAHVWDDAGGRGFLRDRTRRLAVPFFVVGVVILPITFYVWAAGWLVQGRCTLNEIRRVVFAPVIQRDLYGPAHLWFLEYLLLCCLVYAGVRGGWAAAFRGEDAPVGRLRAWLVARPPRLLLLAVPTLAVSLVGPCAATCLHNSFIPSLARWLHYAVFFGAGAVVFASETALVRCVRLVPGCTVAAVLLFPAVLASWPPASGLGGRVVFAVTLAAFTWCALLAAFGVAQRWGARPNPRLAALAGASYWVYLVHFPVVGLVQLTLLPLAVPAALKVVTAVTAGLWVGLWSQTRLPGWLTGFRGRRVAVLDCGGAEPTPAARPATS